jgi:hypothetical protein
MLRYAGTSIWLLNLVSGLHQVAHTSCRCRLLLLLPPGFPAELNTSADLLTTITDASADMQVGRLLLLLLLLTRVETDCAEYIAAAEMHASMALLQRCSTHIDVCKLHRCLMHLLSHVDVLSFPWLQLFWEAFPADGGASRTTYMFAHSSQTTPHSLPACCCCCCCCPIPAAVLGGFSR